MNSKRGGLMLAGVVLMLAVANGAWAASEKVLYAFHGTDGWLPTSVIVGADGALYGTTMNGGTSCGQSDDCGVVFQLTRGSDGKWSETVLHDFGGGDGWLLNGALVADRAGNLYGTTVYGGPNGCSGLGCGVAFELERGSGGTWTYKILHLFFQKAGDGLQPWAGMIFDSKGNLYGTTSGGGDFGGGCGGVGGCGVVFELSPDGKGNWTETVLYSFSGKDGDEPLGPLIFGPGGDLYGTTEYGGAHRSGTVFKLSQRNGKWSEEVLHSFNLDTTDGDQPYYGLTFDRAGNIYGATPFGGTSGEQGWGTAFELAPEKDGRWSETVLQRFNRDKFGGGGVSSGVSLGKSGESYGTANWGGKYDCAFGYGLGCGVVFKLARNSTSGKWAESVLHSFGEGDDGAFPGGGLALDSSGELFGVTAYGGYSSGPPCQKEGCGIVFEVTP